MGNASHRQDLASKQVSFVEFQISVTTIVFRSYQVQIGKKHDVTMVYKTLEKIGETCLH